MKRDAFDHEMRRVLEELEKRQEDEEEAEYQMFLESGLKDKYPLDETFRKKITTLAAQHDKKEKAHSNNGIFISKRVLVSLCCALILLSSTVVIQAVNFHFWELFITPNYTRIIVSEDFKESYLRNSKSGKKVYFPDYVPDGFVLDGIDESNLYIRTTFSHEKSTLTIIQTEISNSLLFLDSEHAEIQEISVNGKEGHYIYSDDTSKLAFYQDEWFIILIAPISKKECLKVAESMS